MLDINASVADMKKAEFEKFKADVVSIENELGLTREEAIEFKALIVGISSEDFELYGLEMLEEELSFERGSIIKWVSEES
jgi:hypothetical protein